MPDNQALGAVKYLTPAECAELSRCHTVTVYLALESGDLHGRQRTKRGRWVVQPDCLEAWLAGELCPHGLGRAA